MSTLIQVFARAPVLGQVKTRLIPEVGAARALAVYEQLLRRTLQQAAATGFALEVWMAGASAKPLESLLNEVGLEAAIRRQQGDDLGARMHHALSDGLVRHRHVMLIGSDIVDLETRHLREASRRLQGGADLVLGPSADGGYYLVAPAAPSRALFNDIDWGNALVLQQTMARVTDLRLKLELLPTCHDLDEGADLRRAEALGVIR
ncbi:MAG: TIGR04282 family arsenosugar biosynthesis glycosyltransferase [Pseudomonadota bacterium]